MEGWGDISNVKSYAELPQSAKNYVKRIEELIGCKISMVGIGPNRDQNLIVE